MIVTADVALFCPFSGLLGYKYLCSKWRGKPNASLIHEGTCTINQYYEN